MSAESWRGIALLAVLLVCLWALCVAGVRVVREWLSSAEEEEAADDLQSPFERGWRMGLDYGVEVGVRSMEPVVDLAEARRVLLHGSREMGVKVRAEMVGGDVDGARLAVKLGEERVVIRWRGRLLAYDWAARTTKGGRRWEYVFAGEISQQPQTKGTI